MLRFFIFIYGRRTELQGRACPKSVTLGFDEARVLVFQVIAKYAEMRENGIKSGIFAIERTVFLYLLLYILYIIIVLYIFIYQYII